MIHLVTIGDRTISSGSQGAAIQSVKLTQCASDGEDLTLGAACADMVEICFLSLDAPLTVGTVFTLFTRENGKTDRVGVFTCQQVQVRGQITKITAYDNLLKLEKDLSGWLAELRQWPYSLTDFAHMVCDACGVTLAEEDIPGGNFSVTQFTGQGVTGRALMQYIGQIAGSFLKADQEGVAHFRWYTPTQIQIRPQGQTFFFADGLKLEEFQVLPVQKVQIRGTEKDVGVVYPDVEAEQVFPVTGNPLLTGAVTPVAKRLYEQLRQVTYRPGQLRVPDSIPVCLGDIVTVTDTLGQQHSFYVMELTRQNRELALSCYGVAQRDSAYSRNNQKFQALNGKLLELSTTVDGLSAQNRDMLGNLAELNLSVEGIGSQVAAQTQENTQVRKELTTLTQTAREISATVQSVEDNGVSRVQTKFGLTLDGSALTIAREGSEMVNKLNEKGMYVVRKDDGSDQTVMLQADADGVVATDVTVRNYLKVGDHARFEDYSDGTDTNRTACFYQ